MKQLKIHKFFDESASISLITNGLRLQRELNTSLLKYGVNLNQSLILLAIFFEPDKSLRATELFGLIPTTKGNISHCTSFLENEKMISRKTVNGDLRGFEFSLTAKGNKLCVSLVKFFDEIESHCDKDFTASEQKHFIAMSGTIGGY